MRPLTAKQLQSKMIDRNGKTWNTAPERNFNEYQQVRGLGLMMNESLPFVAENRQGRMQRFDFQCDFLRPTDSEVYATTGFHNPLATYDIDFEIDGKGHKSKNDEWKDGIKVKAGLRVIHIPGEMTKKKNWQMLDGALALGLLSPNGIVYLDEYSR